MERPCTAASPRPFHKSLLGAIISIILYVDIYIHLPLLPTTSVGREQDHVQLSCRAGRRILPQLRGDGRIPVHCVPPGAHPLQPLSGTCWTPAQPQRDRKWGLGAPTPCCTGGATWADRTRDCQHQSYHHQQDGDRWLCGHRGPPRRGGLCLC